MADEMVDEAGEIETVSDGAASVAPEPLASEHVLSFEEVLEEAKAAERVLVRAGIMGVIIGAILCAGIWTGLVVLSLAIADTSISTGPVLAIGALVGLFAGAFYGGWAGTLYGNAAIEKAEADAEAEEHAHAR